MDYQTLRQAAGDSLDRSAYPPKKLALIHVGVTLLLSLIMTVVGFFLSRSFSAAAGLGNANYRAALETAQVILNFATLLFTPMWSVGFLAVALRTARWSNAEPRDLLDGFRHFGTVLRLYILHAGLLFLVILAATQLASMVFAMTPFSRALTEVAMEAMESGQDPMAALEQVPIGTVVPLYVILFIIIGVISVPLFYRFRLSFFAVAEGEPRARKAMGRSARLMRGNCMAMFRLDLHFWWYYGGLLLLSCLTSVNDIVTLMNISLPFSKEILVYGCYGVYLLGQLLLGWQFSLKVRTTYAHCYDNLNNRFREQTPPIPQAPWTQNQN